MDNTLQYVGDGGDMLGASVECGDRRPVRNDVMLDPDQVEQLKATPGLSYDTTLSGNTGPPLSLGPKTSPKKPLGQFCLMMWNMRQRKPGSTECGQ